MMSLYPSGTSVFSFTAPARCAISLPRSKCGCADSHSSRWKSASASTYGWLANFFKWALSSDLSASEQANDVIAGRLQIDLNYKCTPSKASAEPGKLGQRHAQQQCRQPNTLVVESDKPFWRSSVLTFVVF